MADARVDRGAAFHFAAGRSDHPARLTGVPDAELRLMVVAVTALIDVDAAGLNPSQPLKVDDTGPSVWPSKGLPCSALAWSTNWPLFGLVASRDRDLAAELKRRPCFTHADALHLGVRVANRLVPAMAVIWSRTRPRISSPASLLASDLAADIADHSAQSDAQKLQRPPSVLELARGYSARP
jgi:hypothetical protein